MQKSAVWDSRLSHSANNGSCRQTSYSERIISSGRPAWFWPQGSCDGQRVGLRFEVFCRSSWASELTELKWKQRFFYVLYCAGLHGSDHLFGQYFQISGMQMTNLRILLSDIFVWGNSVFKCFLWCFLKFPLFVVMVLDEDVLPADQRSQLFDSVWTLFLKNSFGLNKGNNSFYILSLLFVLVKHAITTYDQNLSSLLCLFALKILMLNMYFVVKYLIGDFHRAL